MFRWRVWFKYNGEVSSRIVQGRLLSRENAIKEVKADLPSAQIGIVEIVRY